MSKRKKREREKEKEERGKEEKKEEGKRDERDEKERRERGEIINKMMVLDNRPEETRTRHPFLSLSLCERFQGRN